MVANRRSNNGKITRCTCGKVILHVETKKSPNSSGSIQKSKKENNGPKSLKAITSSCLLSRRNRFAASSSMSSIPIIDSDIEQDVKHSYNMCTNCIEKKKPGRDSVPERISLVKGPSSMSKKRNSSRTGMIKALPLDLVVPELRVDGFVPAITIKRTPSRFTFDNVSLISSSSIDSILTDLATTEFFPVMKSGVEQSGLTTLPSLTNTNESEELPPSFDKPKKLSERIRFVSADSEMSIELSEDDFMKMCGKIDDHEIQTTDGFIGIQTEPAKEKRYPGPSNEKTSVLVEETRITTPHTELVKPFWFDFNCFTIS
jgi:hypothetical protein